MPRLLLSLEEAGSEKARRRLLTGLGAISAPALLRATTEEVGRLAHVDQRRAERLSRRAAWLARRIGGAASRGYSLRAAAHVLFVRGRHAASLVRYRSAARIFRAAGDDHELARTLSSSLQALIYLGRYDEALRSAARARAIFARTGDARRLARLDANVGNILFRQDRFREAVRLYGKALESLARVGEPLDTAVTLRNLATCHISLGEFDRALATYEQARQHCQRHGLTRLRLAADYNVPYLYYLRGQYTRALELYRSVRDECERQGDDYHRSLCDLDQAEIFLELNLSEEAGELAERADASFRAQDMAYEAAKARTFQAIARAQRGQVENALRVFGEARKLFTREGNRAWAAAIDLQEALLYSEHGRKREARRKLGSAWRFFSRASYASKAVLCQILLGRLDLEEGAGPRARRRALAALRALERVEMPVLRYQAQLLLGQAEEATGNCRAAYRALQQAAARLHNLRSHIQGDGPRIAFLRDKLAVYESLVRLNLDGRGRRADPEAAFAHIEQAKSRSLAELIAFGAQDLPVPADTHRRWAEKVRRLREELGGVYRQLEHLEGTDANEPRRAAVLGRRAGELETQLLRALGDRRAEDREFRSIQGGQTVSLEAIRTALPEDAMLLEYYEARGSVYACLVSRTHLEIVPVASTALLKPVFRLLQFQLARVRFASEERRRGEGESEATRAHLYDLYQGLIGPLRSRLTARHLIVVPHGFLHYVPFHALFDGERFLVDEFAVSYAPSASVYHLCATRPGRAPAESLVLGVPDPRAPHITEEVLQVAARLPAPQVFQGSEATGERLRTIGARCRFVHIATHGHFRQDNPMFSSIRLGDGHLSLFDLYQLQLRADLVALSGCGTGLSVVVGGDELLGLVRGLLYAGARSALLTLWDVSDQSTAEFMSRFYRNAQGHADWGRAAQQAMIELRESHPHPYHWAPFVVIGQVRPGP